MPCTPNPSCNFRCSFEKPEAHPALLSEKQPSVVTALHTEYLLSSSLQVSATVKRLSEVVQLTLCQRGA